MENQLEQVFEELDTEVTGATGEQFTQFLEDLSSKPVNINRASLEDLIQIPGINLNIAWAMIDRREETPFETVDELINVGGIGKVTLRRIKPYITVSSGAERFSDWYIRPGYWTHNGNVQVISRYQTELQSQRGGQIPDTAGGYLGSRFKYYQRVQYRSDHLQINMTQEKDAGEQLRGINDFDFNSGHIALHNNGRLKSLVIGDYSLSFGQGMVLWAGGAIGKSRDVTGGVNRSERGVRPYSSAQETNFFRGIAATFGDEIEVTGFFSSRPRTASVIAEDTTRFPSTSGLHRTPNENERRNNMNQMVTGGRIRYTTHTGIIGVTGYYNQFSTFIAGSRRNTFNGQEQTAWGIDYRGMVHSVLVFGEIGRTGQGAYGGIAGLKASSGALTQWTLSYRNYASDFHSFLGDGFGEASGSPGNEVGLYAGLKHRLTSRLSLSTYIDQYRFPDARFGAHQPTQGFDVLGLVEVRFTPKLSGYVLIRNERKEEEFEREVSTGTFARQLGQDSRFSARTHLEFQVHPNLRLRSRFELVRNREAGQQWEKGLLMYQDIRLQLHAKMQIDARISVFDTDSFSTRVYQFENDLLFVLTNTALFNSGQRSYLLVKYTPLPYLDFWLKYGVTVYENLQTISSGLNTIQGNVRNSIGLQARLRF
ncbi:MAG: helix-hairpin-helix domain-containing protein [Bacteroidota bacterium]